MTEKQREPVDVNARDAWQIEDKIRGPEGNRGEGKPAGEQNEAGKGEQEGRDGPPSQRPDQDSPWLGGG